MCLMRCSDRARGGKMLCGALNVSVRYVNVTNFLLGFLRVWEKLIGRNPGLVPRMSCVRQHVRKWLTSYRTE